MWILIIALIEIGRIWLVIRTVQKTLFFGNDSYWTSGLILLADWFCLSVLSQVLNAFWPYYPSKYLRHDSWLGNWLRKKVRFLTIFYQDFTLEPNTKYIFASHSHGVLATLQLLTFMFHGNDPLWGNIPENTISTIGSELMIFPLTNLICRLLGARSISRQSLDVMLQSDKHISIIPGGAKEISLCQCNTKDDLYILRRDGFLKLAYKSKRPVVPMITMDNYSMYNIFAGPISLQKFTLKHLNYGFPILAFGSWGSIAPLPTTVKSFVLPPFTAKEDELIENYIARYYDDLNRLTKTFGVTLHLIDPSDLFIHLLSHKLSGGEK
jgi:hypothetical protein